MAQTRIASNPFALMMDPASVIAAMERSERLSRLQSRICRPLDNVTAIKDDEDGDEGEAFSGAWGEVDK